VKEKPPAIGLPAPAAALPPPNVKPPLEAELEAEPDTKGALPNEKPVVFVLVCLLCNVVKSLKLAASFAILLPMSSVEAALTLAAKNENPGLEAAAFPTLSGPTLEL
jgi:hypothetical protein